ncbi:protein Smg [Betaproteobacteria bacterium]|nr:protein Smg [Betaproteobacteria bacterium]GHU15204.1 protein Smg [Betaproteobacteria bacterium]GHU19456.1 protein Smg [Betaproteobacteria bacterium]
MFDVLVYLFESYVHADACPETRELAHTLASAGFGDEDISDALDWLAGLNRPKANTPLHRAPARDSFRVYATAETHHLDTDCRGFLAFLENSGVLDAAARELVIERAMVLDEFNITLTRLKVIVLMVLWRQSQPVDGLIINELLVDSGGDDQLLH